MKLATSTGDFSWYVGSITEKIRLFKGLPFRYINLEQTGTCPELMSEDDEGWKRLADEWGDAAAYAGVRFVVSHAPCLHTPCLGLLENPDDETYRVNIRAIRRSIEICHLLAIDRIVVHACPSESFSEEQFFAYNRKFYGDLFDLTEKYGITVMTENWDNTATRFSTGQQLREFVDAVGHPLLGVCWDTAHGNIDPTARAIGQYDNITAIGEKLKGMHVADNFGDCHHHTWPFAGIINFDSVLQALLDVQYDGYFTFEASYTLLHRYNIPHYRQDWEYNGQKVTKLVSPPVELKQKAVELLYEIGKYLLETYGCFEP